MFWEPETKEIILSDAVGRSWHFPVLKKFAPYPNLPLDGLRHAGEVALQESNIEYTLPIHIEVRKSSEDLNTDNNLL